METIRYLYKGGQGEIEEKKSRFIANLRPVENEEEAQAFISEMKKKYWDARHNCSAFVTGENGEITRCSDDGEPSGTSGRPMLEILENSGVRNASVVVTRYFGGVLLGTGGLIRAYGDAVRAGLDNSVIIEKINGVLCYVKLEYPDLARLNHIFQAPPFLIKDTIYGEKVEFELLLPMDELKASSQKVTEASGGRVELKPKETCRYAKAEGELVITDIKRF